MSRANSNPLVAALLWALCALCAASGAAAQSNDTLVTPFEPTLTPWAAGCSVVSSSSSAGTEGMSTGRITLGPCASRQLHWHAYADEWLSMTAPTGARRRRRGRRGSGTAPSGGAARADPRPRPRAQAWS